MTQPSSPTTASSDWLDRFFESYYRHRPVNATFIGHHEHDHALPDFSEGGVGDALAEARHLLDHCPDNASGWPEVTDLRLARGYLRCQLWELESRHFQGGNPSTYVGEAVFGVMSLFLTSFAPLDERVESAVQRLEGIPKLLRQARENVRSSPQAWIGRAVTECRGTLAFLNDTDLLHPNLRQPADRAARAVADYAKHLETLSSSQHYACGSEAFSMYLSDGHFLDQDAAELVRYAREQLTEATAALRDSQTRPKKPGLPESRIGGGDSGPPQIDQASADALTNQLRRLHPPVDQYYARYQDIWDQMKAQSESLLTWPDFPIRYIARPGWARAAGPDLYFLFYRSPAAINRPPIHDYLVTPIEPEMPEAQQLLEANNDSVIKLNHVIHHGGIGHHVQNWHAFRSQSRIGRIAAVDCASRIAMFCGGTMAEGWACYATDLMSEQGALTPLEQMAELQSRRRMCARAIVDVELHQGRFSLDQAAAFYQEHAGMPQAAAHREAVKNSMFPGAAVMYLMGTDQIHQLRSELSLPLREFHDEFLSFGSIPVSLIAAEMRRRHA